MKKVLLVSLLAIAGVSISAQNLIKNEKFATEVTNKVTNPSTVSYTHLTLPTTPYV